MVLFRFHVSDLNLFLMSCRGLLLDLESMPFRSEYMIDLRSGFRAY